MNHKPLLIALVTLLGAGCATTGNAPSAAEEETALGREQLIRAFDAGWIRVIASGKDNEILKTEPPNRPGMAASYMVKLVDCLPQPELADFPAEPVGLFKDVLDSGVLRKLVQAVPSNPNNTSWYFSGISDKYLRAVLDEIGAHYGVSLTIEEVPLPPGTLPSTSALLDGRVDFVGQLNATGGNTQGLRRRNSRRFTCTMSASSQYIHIPSKAELAGEINTWTDLVDRPDVRICAGPLTTQTARAFLPQHKVKTVYVNDLSGCVKQIESGKADVILNPLPSLQIADIKGFKSVHTLIVAGTPLWVALEGIECDPEDDDPRTEAECREINPP